ncbi:hypothetical protein BD414DRAFT_474412 [Trametes punicea]|nr:hypothetical protein BD414DRAFT_474412 [Trametes punicea]
MRDCYIAGCGSFKKLHYLLAYMRPPLGHAFSAHSGKLMAYIPALPVSVAITIAAAYQVRMITSLFVLLPWGSLGIVASGFANAVRQDSSIHPHKRRM